MPDLTPQKIAENILERIDRPYSAHAIALDETEIGLLRKTAAGEYKRVVHAYWIRKYDTLSQNYNSDENWYFVCSECGSADTNRAKYCHCCSALMDGKDDAP